MSETKSRQPAVTKSTQDCKENVLQTVINTSWKSTVIGKTNWSEKYVEIFAKKWRNIVKMKRLIFRYESTACCRNFLALCNKKFEAKSISILNSKKKIQFYVILFL